MSALQTQHRYKHSIVVVVTFIFVLCSVQANTSSDVREEKGETSR